MAVLMLNDDRTHEVAFGLQRSGLYYTMVNTHLAAEEAAYIVLDCGARTLITSAALASLATDLVARTPEMELRLMIGDPVAAGHTSYDEFVAAFPGEPLAEEVEGSPMLYSSGTTGHPKGIRRPLQRTCPSAPTSSTRACWAASWASPPETCTSAPPRCTTRPRSCGP